MIIEIQGGYADAYIRKTCKVITNRECVFGARSCDQSWSVKKHNFIKDIELDTDLEKAEEPEIKLPNTLDH